MDFNPTQIPSERPPISGTAAEPPVDDGSLFLESDVREDPTPVVSTDLPAGVPTESATEVQAEAVEPESKAILTDRVDFSNPALGKQNYTVSLPARSLGMFSSLLRQAQATDQKALESDSTEQWREVTESMSGMYTPMGLYQERFHDEGSNWRQGVLLEDGRLLQTAAPKFRSSGGELRGEEALLKISKALGQGEVQTIQLPHSGINLTVKPPSETSIINFYNSIYKEKISMGRMTAGLTLSNFSVYINNRLFDFIVDHVHSINYSDITKDQLKKYVVLPDFYLMAQGFASAMHPNGFEYQRPCINGDNSCFYVAEGLLNMAKTVWVDNSALTDFQKKTLAEVRPGRLTLDHYKKYQMDHARVAGSSFVLTNGMRFFTRIPTFEEYVTDGMDWVNSINAAVDAVIVIDGDEEKARSELMQLRIKSSMLRQFSHYIDRIDTGEGVISHRETLNNVLNSFSADDGSRDEIFSQILQFKSKTTIAIIGIPEYKCPNCHKLQNTEPVNEGLVNVIPLDVMNLFFTLLTLRMSRILER